MFAFRADLEHVSAARRKEFNEELPLC